jgi:carboxymethylenebutenolidase
MHVVNGGVSGFAGGVAFYGLPYMNGATPIRDSLAKIKVPVMLFNGSKDARIGAAMPAVDSAMKALGKNYVGTNYEGAVHGFMRSQDDPKATRDPTEEAANLAATKDAWPRTVEFLRRNLGMR